ncbi:hypothetical protein XENORESO_010674 [Xenotaenia resolanae]|uniref:Uncharacterized protein n=1 Tax=Xenotaenia resolanae TaxID=208358 RepID=A0ABV0VQ63_9TELE
MLVLNSSNNNIHKLMTSFTQQRRKRFLLICFISFNLAERFFYSLETLHQASTTTTQESVKRQLTSVSLVFRDRDSTEVKKLFYCFNSAAQLNKEVSVLHRTEKSKKPKP